MTEHNVNITPTAENDILQALDYIENNLLNPDAANTLEAEIGDKLASLNIYPHRFPIPNDPFFKTAVIRFIVIKSI